MHDRLPPADAVGEMAERDPADDRADVAIAVIARRMCGVEVPVALEERRIHVLRAVRHEVHHAISSVR